jgi:hypothetical protein
MIIFWIIFHALTVAIINALAKINQLAKQKFCPPRRSDFSRAKAYM